MNKRIKELAEQAEKFYVHECTANASHFTFEGYVPKQFLEKFAELIVEECRNIVIEVYRNTPLELCGPLLIVDEKIAEHFYGVKE